MNRLPLIAAVGAATLLSACMEDGGGTPSSTDPVVVVPAPTSPVVTNPSRPVVTGQSGGTLGQTISGKGPVNVDASAM